MRNIIFLKTDADKEKAKKEKAEVIAKKLEEEKVDVTMPGKTKKSGSLHPINQISDEMKEKLVAIAKEKGILQTGGTEFMGMYSKKPVSLGEYTAPDAAVKALMSYKAKMKKKKAAEAARVSQ